MDPQLLNIRSVAVVGAGVSGVATAVHLNKKGLDVTVFERTSRAGGVWVFDERAAKDAAYPSVLPSIGDSPDGELLAADSRKRCDSPVEDDTSKREGTDSEDHERLLQHAPPGPCYAGLKNNVSTTEMEMQCQAWKPGTEDFVPQYVLADYIQDAAIANNVERKIKFNTRVQHIEKVEAKWAVRTTTIDPKDSSVVTEHNDSFDAVVVASGHYHACKIPDIPGLAEWKRRFPDRVQHSKLYRRPDPYKGLNVLLIGAGVSSTDIARELGPVAKTVFQVSRGGMYDLPSHLLPANGARVGAVESFGDLPASTDKQHGTEDAIPGVVTLPSGKQLCDIHRVIICTGYHVSFPFMRQYHADGLDASKADDRVLVTDGTQTHNLHLDMYYIPDPTLAFVGVPYHVATFSFFEFQAIMLAAVFAGEVGLPSGKEMRKEYRERLVRKGAGRTFHSLKGQGDEIAYVDHLVDIVNGASGGGGRSTMRGHSPKWHEAYARRVARQKMLFNAVRDPTIDREILSAVAPCW